MGARLDPSMQLEQSVDSESSMTAVSQMSQPAGRHGGPARGRRGAAGCRVRPRSGPSPRPRPRCSPPPVRRARCTRSTRRGSASLPLTLTTIFAVYVLALLLSLLTAGRLSDVVGRRPGAGRRARRRGRLDGRLPRRGRRRLAVRRPHRAGPGHRCGHRRPRRLPARPAAAGRFAAGLAGQLRRRRRPAWASGAVGTGLLVQYAPHPTRLVFVVLLALFAVLLAARRCCPRPCAASRARWPRCARRSPCPSPPAARSSPRRRP